MPLPSNQHPSQAKLRQFLSGDLLDAEIEEIDGHIQICSPCLQNLQMIPSSPAEEFIKTHKQPTDVTIHDDPSDRRKRERHSLANKLLTQIKEQLNELHDIAIHRFGGMGFILSASRIINGANCRRAFKVFCPQYVAISCPDANPASLKVRFEREYDVLKVIRHPNIVRVHTFIKLNDLGVDIIEMDWLEGESIYEIAGDRRVSIEEARNWLFQLLSALSAVHKSGVIHRDISPSNCFITAGSRLILTDFGLASRPDATELTKLTYAGFMGTIRFASPQQKLNTATARATDDVFSVGSTILWALSDPDSRNHDGVPECVMRRLDPKLRSFLSRMIIFAAEERFQSAMEAVESFPPFVSERQFHLGVPARRMLFGVFGVFVISVYVFALRIAKEPTSLEKTPTFTTLRANTDQMAMGKQHLDGSVGSLAFEFSTTEPQSTLSLVLERDEGHDAIVLDFGKGEDGHNEVSLLNRDSGTSTILLKRPGSSWSPELHSVEIQFNNSSLDALLDNRRVLFIDKLEAGFQPGTAEVAVFGGSFEISDMKITKQTNP